MTTKLEQISDEECGQLELTDEEYERARTILLAAQLAEESAARGHFSRRARESTYEVDREALLDQVTTLQERMIKGMALIHKTNTQIEEAWKANSYAGLVFKAFSGKLEEARAKKILRHPNNKRLVSLFDTRAKLWNHWRKLQTESNTIATEHNLWHDFFALGEYQFNRWFIHGEVDETLDNARLADAERNRGNDLRDIHLEEMAAMNVVINAPLRKWEKPFTKQGGCLTRHWEKGDPQVWKVVGSTVEYCPDNTFTVDEDPGYLDSMMQEAQLFLSEE
jgi:hypothetical protein